ncbi:MAG: efflux RND transporter periplasmic adaptor subunit [Chitinophagaceae bacterium]|nr:efflux RND transporter periplasmic adaptor subunit [Chitinophagaceae bacterium]
MRLNNFIAPAALLLLMACSSKSPKLTNEAEDAVLVKTVAPLSTEYKPILQYSGMMATTNEAKMSFKIGGIISKIYVKEGDVVAKGQLLATLNLTEINAQLQQSNQALEKAKRDVNRVKGLYNDTAATLEQYQNVQTQLELAKENNRIVQFSMEYAQIRAVDNGTVVKKLSNEGEMIAAGSPVFIINGTANSDWVIRFGVADKDWSVLKIGGSANVLIDAYPDKIFQGIITKKASSADPYSNTYELEVKVVPEKEKFASGLFATIQLNTSPVSGLKLIPIEALVEADAKTGYIYTLNADKKTVRKVQVQIAYINKETVAIKSGLENIAEVITDGVNNLTETTRVTLVK